MSVGQTDYRGERTRKKTWEDTRGREGGRETRGEAALEELEKSILSELRKAPQEEPVQTSGNTESNKERANGSI